MPRLRRYREIHPVQRPVFATQLGRRCGELLHLAPHPAVICVEKPYLGGFVEGFVNGGDAPVTVDQQSIIGKLPGLEACFAMNLHKAVDARFVPLPIGLPHHCDGLHRGNLRAASEAESLIQQCRAKATPWNLRSQRLLVTPMQANRLRERYLERLSSPAKGMHHGEALRCGQQKLFWLDCSWSGASDIILHNAICTQSGRVSVLCTRKWYSADA